MHVKEFRRVRVNFETTKSIFQTSISLLYYLFQKFSVPHIFSEQKKNKNLSK